MNRDSTDEWKYSLLEDGDVLVRPYTFVEIASPFVALGVVLGISVLWWYYTHKEFIKAQDKQLKNIVTSKCCTDFNEEWLKARQERRFQKAYKQTLRWIEKMFERMEKGEPMLPEGEDDELNAEEWAWYDDYASCSDDDDEDDF